MCTCTCICQATALLCPISSAAYQPNLLWSLLLPADTTGIPSDRPSIASAASATKPMQCHSGKGITWVTGLGLKTRMTVDKRHSQQTRTSARFLHVVLQYHNPSLYQIWLGEHSRHDMYPECQIQEVWK